MRGFTSVLLLLLHGVVFSQLPVIPLDTVTIKETARPDKISIAIYGRIISDANGKKRADENVVGNFRLLNWLYLEAGLRQGERPGKFFSYYHYKLELQSKYFLKSIRVFARLSDNVNNYPSTYRKTNTIFAVEAKHRFGRYFQVNCGLGYLISSQQDHVPDALPTTLGRQYNTPVYRIAARYVLKNKSFFEIAHGTYDVFNPYEANHPFVQMATEQELTRLCALMGYFRYQYAQKLSVPFNYFVCIGIRLHVRKGN